MNLSMIERMLPGITVYDCDQQDTVAYRSPLVAHVEMTRCTKCRMPPVVFDRWGLPWCTTHLNTDRKNRTK